MFLKKLIVRRKLIMAAVLAVFLLAACAPAAQGLTQLPEEGRTLVLTLITAAFTWLFLFTFNKLGWDLRGYAQPLAAVLSPIAITIIEHYLPLIPSQYDDVVTWVIHLLVLLFGSIGTFFVVRGLRSKAVLQNILR